MHHRAAGVTLPLVGERAVWRPGQRPERPKGAHRPSQGPLGVGVTARCSGARPCPTQDGPQGRHAASRPVSARPGGGVADAARAGLSSPITAIRHAAWKLRAQSWGGACPSLARCRALPLLWPRATAARGRPAGHRGCYTAHCGRVVTAGTGSRVVSCRLRPCWVSRV